MVAKKTLTSSKTSRATDELESRFTDIEKKMMKQDDSIDVSISNSLKDYRDSMGKGMVAGNIPEKQLLFWNTLQVIFNSAPEDYSRRMTLLLHYVEEMSREGGALHGKLPMRGIVDLPPSVDSVAFAHMMSFLSLIGPSATRQVGLRNVNMEQVALGVPAEKQQNFKQYFNTLR